MPRTEARVGSIEITPTGGSVTFASGHTGQQTANENPRIRVLDKQVECSFSEYLLSLLRRQDIFRSIVSRQWLSAADDEAKTQCSIEIQPVDRTEAELENGNWVEITAVTARLETVIHSTPLELSAGEFNGTPVAAGTAKNIFPSMQDASETILVSVIGKDGAADKSTVMFPKPGGGEPEWHDMNITEPSEDI